MTNSVSYPRWVQDLVDDHLENERRRQREDLNEQRRRKHVAERLAIAPQRRQKPAQTELLRTDPGAADAACDQQHSSVRLARQLLKRDIGRGVAYRIDQPARAGSRPPAKDVKRSVPEANDRGRRDFSHSLFVYAGHQPGLQADHLRCSDEIEIVGGAIPKVQFAAKSGSDRRQFYSRRRFRSVRAGLRQAP